MRQVTHVLLTRPPLIRFPKETSSLDLHVLSTPPAFILSQDRTLKFKQIVFKSGQRLVEKSVESLLS